MKKDVRGSGPAGTSLSSGVGPARGERQMRREPGPHVQSDHPLGRTAVGGMDWDTLVSSLPCWVLGKRP